MNDSFTENERRAAAAAAQDSRLPNSLAPSANPADYAKFQPHVGQGDVSIQKRAKSKPRRKVDFTLPENGDPNTDTLNNIFDNREHAILDSILDRGKRFLTKKDPAFSPERDIYSEIHKADTITRPVELPARVHGTIAGQNEFQIDEVDFELYDPDISANLPQPHPLPAKPSPLMEEREEPPSEMAISQQMQPRPTTRPFPPTPGVMGPPPTAYNTGDPPMQPLLVQLYLSIREAKDIVPREAGRRNLFVKYKSYPQGEDMMTKVEYNQNSPHFKHQAQSAMLISTDSLIALRSRKLLIELWDRISPSKDELVGVIPLTLEPFFHCFRVGETPDGQMRFSASGVINSLYPVIGHDDYLPVQDLLQSRSYGFLRITLAMGTTAQVARLQERERREIEAVLAAFPDRTGGVFSALTPTGRVEMHPDSVETLGLKTPPNQTFAGSPEPTKPQKSPWKSPIYNMDEENELEKSPVRTPGKVTAGPSLQARNLSSLNLLRKLFENMHHADLDIPTLLGKQPLLDAKSSKLEKLEQGLVNKDQLVEAVLRHPAVELTRTDAIRVFNMFMEAIDSPSEYNPDELLDINELILCQQFFEKTRHELSERLRDLFGKVVFLFKKEAISDKLIDSVLKTLRQESAPEGLVTISQLRNALAKYDVALNAGLADQFIQYLAIDFNRGEQPAAGTLVNIAPFIHFLRNGTSLATASLMPVDIRVYAEEVQSEIREALELGKMIRADMKDWVSPKVVEGEMLRAYQVQKELRRQGVTLSIFQVAALLQLLNAKYASLYTEPRRFCLIEAKHFARFFGIDVQEAEAAVRQDANQQANDIAKWMNQKKADGVVKAQKDNKRRTNLLKEDYDADLPPRPMDLAQHLDEGTPDRPIRRPPPRIKHVFTVQVSRMVEIPMLHYLVRDLHPSLAAQTHLQAVALQFRFPLDPEQSIESDYISIEKNEGSKIPQNYVVGLESCHSIVLDYEGDIEPFFKPAQPFTLRLVVKGGVGKEQCIGSVQLPGQDLIELIHNFKSKSVNYHQGVAWLKRIVFIYGTAISERENCVIGKLHLRINYHTAEIAQPKIKPERGVKLLAQEESVLLQRETLVNRKLPLHGTFALKIQKLVGMREAIENAEFLDKHTSLSGTDRLPDITKMYRSGLNLSVRCSLFQQDPFLSASFVQGEQKLWIATRIQQETLNPSYDENFFIKFHMNEALLNYLKGKRALFQVIFHTAEGEEILGSTWVPLLPMLSNVNGISGEFELLNSLQQSMGFLRLGIQILKADEPTPQEKDKMLSVTRAAYASQTSPPRCTLQEPAPLLPTKYATPPRKEPSPIRRCLEESFSPHAKKEKAKAVETFRGVELEIIIRAGYGLSHPLDRAKRPNCFVRIQNPYFLEEIMQTHVVPDSVNPAWQQLPGRFRIPTEFIEDVSQNGLQAEVFHHGTYITMDGYSEERDVLIGQAKLDLSALFLKDSAFGSYPMLDGFYHVFSQTREDVSIGQLAVGVQLLTPKAINVNEEKKVAQQVFSTFKETSLEDLMASAQEIPCRDQTYMPGLMSRAQAPRMDASINDVFASIQDLQQTLTNIGKEPREEFSRVREEPEFNEFERPVKQEKVQTRPPPAVNPQTSNGNFQNKPQTGETPLAMSFGNPLQKSMNEDLDFERQIVEPEFIEIQKQQEEEKSRIPEAAPALESTPAVQVEPKAAKAETMEEPRNIFLENLASNQEEAKKEAAPEPQLSTSKKPRAVEFSDVSPEEFQRIEKIMNPRRYDSDDE